MRLLIADDEAMIRQGIIARIQFLNLPIREIRQAASGMEALHLLEENPVDIILTDIKMPGMDGLELIKCVKEKYPEIKFMILSGYAEFEYARGAMNLGVHQYLLKPISNEDLKIAFEKLLGEIEAEQELKLWRYKRNQLLEYKNDIELEREINHYLSGHIEDVKAYPRLSQKCSEFFNHSSQVYLGILHIEEETYQESQFSERNIDLLHFLIKNVVEEICPQFEKRIFVNLSHIHELYIVLMKPKQDENFMAHFYNELQKVLTVGFRIIFSLSFSKGRDQLSIEGLKEAKKALRHRILHSGSQLYVLEEVSGKAMVSLPVEAIKELEHFILASNLTQIQSWLERYLEVNYIRKQGLEYLNDVCERVIALLIKVTDQSQHKHLIPNVFESLKEMPKLESIDEQRQRLYKCIVDCVTQEDFSQLDSKSKMYMAAQYIKEHYNEDIPINGLAEKFDMSPTYFSSLFKKEMGKSTVNYITAYRVEKAKHYLATSNRSVVDIAKRVGYEDSQYFFRVFKKQEGMSPLQYRQQCQKENE